MLEKAGEQTASWSTLLVFMLSSRLDPVTLRHWETHRKSTLVPSYTDLVNFLRNHSLVLQSLDASKGRSFDSSRLSTHRFPSHPAKPNLVHSAVTAQKSCPFCKQLAHSPYQCEVFRKMTPIQRFEATKKNALCINCLSPSHLVKACTSGTCRVCQQRHHTMLHQRPIVPNSQSVPPTKPTDPQTSSSYTPNNRQQSASSSKQSLQPESQTQATAVPAPQTSHFSMPFTDAEHIVPATVLLSTALVKVYSSSGSSLWARALLDSGSQLNFVSEHIVQNLKLHRSKEFVPISGVGLSSTSSKYTTIIRIQSHCADFEDNWKFHVLPKLTLELPNQAVDVCRSRWPSDVVLADPTFDQPGRIDLILGVGIFYDLLRDGQIKNRSGDPVLQNTALGWVVSGKVQAKVPSASVSNFAHVAPSPTIEDQLSRFWEIESCRTLSTHSVEEAECEKFFEKTVERDQSGRFIVALPTKSSVISMLGSSKDIADRRFYSLERRLNATPALKEAYTAFIHEYVQLGHMQPISDAETHTLPSYYLPHHCIVRPDSITTKLRVVFDASCSSDSGVSLNDALLVGPVIQDDLLSIVLRFRMPQFAIIADIEKMYRQIRVRKCDHPLQRIRWRDSATQPLQTFQLTTVTYGTSSAPYLATKCLQKLAEDGSDSHPEAAMVLGRDFYMDDMLTGTDSIEEVTKQIVLSDIARLFDPLGLAGPVLVQAKLFLQDLWRDGCDWKEPLNENRQHQWLELRDSFQHLAALRIPRWVVATTGVVSLEVHGFSDASERAYGACIYLRAVSSTGSIHVNLLTAKSKIAPNGKSKRAGVVSLPRLELCGALLLSHLFEKVEFSLKLKAQNFFWTDSEITLYQITASPSRWKTFVANRSSEIQRITADGMWSHVPGSENPADIISRGMCPEQLQNCTGWWHGPDWLSQPSRFWPPLGRPTNRIFSPEELEERTVSLPVQIQSPNELFLLYSTYFKLVRTVAWIQRFAHNARTKDKVNHRNGFLSTAEIKDATLLLVKLAQQEHFAQDLAEISRNGQVKSNSRLKSLFPILVNGVIRVGGRLRHAPVPYDQRHPMILPDKHRLTEMVMVYYHRKLLHAGPQLLAAVVRERFWPLRIRNLSRRVVHAHTKCFQCKPQVLEQLMEELSVERVTLHPTSLPLILWTIVVHLHIVQLAVLLPSSAMSLCLSTS
ncbi:uncharacterized protein LOC134207280 [Armigeres subalbatus]|uniref:uncharacterized protein LOC134207280 n=1 Tax=Armigeres subalbatus TaxID=124917 RepID=UPI002ED5808E